MHAEQPCAWLPGAWDPSPHAHSPVCHQVSTSVHLLSPTTLWSHSQASWLIGSPTATTPERVKDINRPQ